MVALIPGHKIHRYEILKVLGQGGFGIVYLVKHVTLGYEVVIKEYLPKELATRHSGKVVPINTQSAAIYDDSLRRFKSECETLLKLSHQHIVYVYDCFYEAGTAYMVMHREHGQTLWDIFCHSMQGNKQPLSWQTLKPVLPGILSALEYLHNKQIAHRDIKPGNIFLRSDQRNHPIIIDFGAVKIGRGYASNYAQKTPIYAALEQEDEVHPIGPWTDIHALSIMLIELLTGHRTGTALERSKSNDGDSATTALVKQVASMYGEQLASALYHASQLYPEHRYQSIADFRNALPI